MNLYVYEIKDIMQIMKISRNTAYRLVKESRIPYIRIGGHYKFPAESFEKWFLNLHSCVDSAIIIDKISSIDGPANDERSVW